jgi:hypothetical protein
MAANAVKNNASATPQIKINAYYSLMSASEAFIDGFAIRNFDELQAVIDKSELALVNAIEGSAPGQYRAGAKADLDTSLNLSGSRKLLEEKPKGPQYTLDFNIFWALRALSKFEGERIAENQTVLSPQSGVYTTTSWTIQSTSVTGAVYAVPNSEFPLTLFDLQAAVTKGEARSVPMNGSVVVQLNVSGLKAGDYKLYHVDETGKLSRAFLNYAIIPSSASSVVVQSSRNHTGAISNKITWTDSVSSGVTYSILRGTSPGYGESTLLVESIAPGTNEFIDNDPDLKPGTTYYYRVAAMTRDNNGSFTNDIPVVTPSE